jgi:squalene synthase HpnC
MVQPGVPAPAADRLRTAERAENFPVALRALPARPRARLRAVYDVVRTIDDLGDEGSATPQARTDALRAFAADLEVVWSGDGLPREPVLRALVPHARAGWLPREPFDRLLAANLADQEVTHYATWDELLGYCALSAAPIGRLVLAAFGVDVPPGSVRERTADRVCTALQLLEHWQDVAEDRDRGRVYLPAHDRAEFGVGPAELAAPHAGPAVRSLLAHETDRALALLEEGRWLVDDLHGWARVAVAGYLAGGLAAADSLRRCGHDVLAGTPPTRRRDVARHLARLLAAVDR